MAGDTNFVKGAAKLGARIATIRQSYSLPKFTAEITDLLLNRTLRRFDRQVDPDEHPWPAITEAGAKSKQRAGYGGRPLLRRSGKMRDSIRAIRGGVGTIFTNTGAKVRIGIDDPEVAKYAAVHNKGQGRFPMRRFIGLGRLDIRAVDSLLRRKAKQIEES